MTTSEIDRLLGDARIGRLCMAGCDGRPYAIPLPFCFAGGNVYLRVPMKGRKGQILEENNQVCFEVDAFTDSLDEYSSVLIEGELVGVTDLGEKERVKEANDRKYERLRGGFRPGHGRATPPAEVALRKIVMSRISGRKKESNELEKGAVLS